MRHHRVIRFVTQTILNVAKRQGNYELNDSEKNTLLKSASKLLIAHSREIHGTWRQMCQFLKKCGVNIFEMKDQRGEGIEHRLIKAWPTGFTQKGKMNNILQEALTD
jgi:hypothetical protein